MKKDQHEVFSVNRWCRGLTLPFAAIRKLLHGSFECMSVYTLDHNGAIAGHYHDRIVQYILCISGLLRVTSETPGSFSSQKVQLLDSSIPGGSAEGMLIPPGIAHYIEAIGRAAFIDFSSAADDADRIPYDFSLHG